MSGQLIHPWLSKNATSAMLLYYPILCHWWALSLPALWIKAGYNQKENAFLFLLDPSNVIQIK